MNKTQRKEIERIMDELDDIRTHIDYIRDDEEEKYYNLPEGIQDSERGEAIQESIDQLEYASDSIEEAIGYLQELVE